MVKNKVKVAIARTTWLQGSIIAFVVGSFYGYFFPVTSDLMIVIFVLTGIFFFLWRHTQIWLFWMILMLMFCGGLVRMQGSLHHPDPGIVDYYNGQEVVLTGMIRDLPDVRPDRSYLTVDIQSLTVGKESQHITGKVLMKTAPYPSFDYGDVLRLEGRLLTPQDRGGSFSYVHYLAKDDIFSIMENPSIQMIASHQGNLLYAGLYAFRQSMGEHINRLFPEPSGSLLAGLLLGIRKTMPQDLSENLQRTGLTHIIALSGFNITIIITFIAGFLFARFRRSLRFLFATVIIILFTILVGAAPSVVRAAVMGIVGLFALTVGRKAESLSILLLALMVMILLHPLSLIYDVGFQLSFLATLGLILISPVVRHVLEKVPNMWGIKEILITTVSAQIAVLPLLLSSFERLSLVSILCNILVLGIIPLTMLFGFLALLLSFIPWFFILAKVIGFVAFLLLAYIIAVVNIFASIPFSSFLVSWWSLSLSVVFYLVLACVLFSFYNKVRKTKTSVD